MSATVAAVFARMLQQRLTVLVAAVSILIAANVVATCVQSVAASVAPVVAKKLQKWVTVFVAVVIVIIAGGVVARFAVNFAAYVVVLTAVAKVAATVA